MFTWTSAAVSPALIPDQAYDAQGVFTGCWLPPTEGTDKILRVAYSSVKKLPFHWSTPPYPRDAAGLAVAASHDGGNTWSKSPQNPILAGEPTDLKVTGFRDPFVTELSSIDEARVTSETALYGLVSGGIEGSGPTSFLYEIQRNDVEKWKYLGPLVDMPMRFQPSKKWSGNYGINWECTNVMTLRTGTESRQFLIIGAEGDVEKDHVKNYERSVGSPNRTVRAQLWMSGQLKATSLGVRFSYEHGGYLDHGPYYAANSLLDPDSGRRIVYGWIPEEDLPLAATKEKGWNGSLAIPREIFLLRIPRVQGTLHTKLPDISPFELKTEPDGSTTVFTLGVKPLSEFERVRETSQQVLKFEVPLALPGSDGIEHRILFQTRSATWELESTVAVHPGCETVGFHLRHNKDMSIRTTLTFNAITETISVDRDASTTDTTINKCPDAGPFTLLYTPVPDDEGQKALEKLHLRIFSDGHILEVFANSRFALATMVYSEGYVGGLTAFATGSAGSAVFEDVTVWDGLHL